MRLVMTVLVLVVLPTALLSVLAGKSIRTRELILDRRLSRDASAQLDKTAADIERLRVGALDAVGDLFRTTLMAGLQVTELEASVAFKTLPDDLVILPLLFLNPWGFVYPDVNAASSSAFAPLADRFQPSLTGALADGTLRRRGQLALAVGQRLFCFRNLPDYHDLYIGMEVNLEGIRRRLDRMLADRSGPFVRFKVTAFPDPGRAGDADQRAGVLVLDSLETAPVATPVAFSHRRDSLMLSRRLYPPLDMIEIGAEFINAADRRQALRLDSQLTIWGILLLAVVICSSAVILISNAWRQADAARRRSAFMAAMSHDLRTPVTAMRVLAESLRSGRIEDETRRREFLDSMITESDRLADLIDRVMFFFRQEQGPPGYHRSRIFLDRLAMDVAERARRQYGGRVHIRVLAGSAVAPVLADANAMEKALTNLVDNAVKYGKRSSPAPTDDIEVQVSLRWRRQTAWVVLSVRDFGRGLAEGEPRRVFKRFYRGSDQAHAHRGGFGLGLSLVADIVRAHRGRVTAGNAPDGGAVFEMWLKAEREGGAS